MNGDGPVYYTDAGLADVYTNGDVAPYVNWSANGYRLPTEAEWEKAARGGLAGNRFPRGNTIAESQANYYGDTSDYKYDLGPAGYPIAFGDGVGVCTSPVEYFAPNAYGLYDMAGNTDEWCWDWYGPYQSGLQTDPRGPSAGSYRILRGGSWVLSAYDCRVANRSYYYAGLGENVYSFRTVMNGSQQ
jgi:formylglycine-generating enzyme required for sulfatase activity